MKCEKCNQNEAAFFYQQQINGHATKMALCHACAQEAGLLQESDPLSLLLGGFPTHTLHTARPRSAGAACPACGATFAQIANDGRVGCAACYEAFRERLAPSIRAMHGNATHTGRVPAAKAAAKTAPPDTAAPVSKADALRAALQEAVANEEFERAATLRDELRTLQAKEDT